MTGSLVLEEKRHADQEVASVAGMLKEARGRVKLGRSPSHWIVHCVLDNNKNR